MKKLLKSTWARITIGVIAVFVIVIAIAYFTSRPLIAQEDAKTIALAEAGVTQEEVISLEVVANDDYYTVTFVTEEKNYSFDVAKDNGDVIRASFTIDGETTVDSNAATEEETATTEENTTSDTTGSDSTISSSSSSNSSSTNTSSSSSTASNTTTTTSTSITEESAKAIALADAGVSSSDLSYISVDIDYDHGQLIYEIDFYANGTEYEYDISGSDGSIISMDYEVKYSGSSSSSSGAIISLSEASEIALGRVSGATSSNLKIKLDYDDGRQVYEGEIIYGGMEYEFKIDAYSGSVIEWSAESRD